MTLDGETCENCYDNYYFDENGKCISNNYCLKENDYHCENCADGYFLSDGHECIKDKNCKIRKKDLYICALCKENYYLEFQDGKCKSNKEDNDFLNIANLQIMMFVHNGLKGKLYQKILNVLILIIVLKQKILNI